MFTEEQIEFLRAKNYLKKDESIHQRFDDVVNVVRKYEACYSPGLSDRIKILLEDKVLSLSTPQLANVGRNDSNELNCSCNIIGVQNKIQGIYYSYGEAAVLSKLGAGVGIDFTSVYDKGTKIGDEFYSNSKLDWIETSVEVGQKVSQGSKRRGYVVPFISIEDKEFYDLLKRIDRSNPNKKDPLISNNIGVILPSGYRNKIKDGDKEARKRFLEVLKYRKADGKVYLLDVDNCNNNQSPVYKSLGHVVTQTNICTEALSPFYEDKTFACILSSLNLVHWDRIKSDPQIIKDSFMFLDIMVEEYIRMTKDVQFLDKVNKSAREKRDIGLGTLGFAELLQMKGLAFGDVGSRILNKEIYSTIRKYGEEYTKEIAEKLGPAPMALEAGLMRRNVSLMMIAPNKSTSFIMGTSEGIEPYRNNYMLEVLAGIQSVFKNPYLTKILEDKGKNTPDVWEDIMKNLGSVQHLDFLSDREKDIFKTASEISPKDIIDLASDRQVYIDMSQSLNLFNRPNYTTKDLYDIHIYAFSKGIKTLYYLYPQSHAVFERGGSSKWDSCVSCAD